MSHFGMKLFKNTMVTVVEVKVKELIAPYYNVVESKLH